jgi:hypothetical protein
VVPHDRSLGSHPEEQVTERHVRDARCSGFNESRPHALLVDLVRARVREHDVDQGQPRRSRLSLDQFPPYGVHRHPVERLVERGQEPDDFDVGSLAEDVERPGAILAGTPGEEDFRSWAAWLIPVAIGLRGVPGELLRPGGFD